jgi:hypothetical protein
MGQQVFAEAAHCPGFLCNRVCHVLLQDAALAWFAANFMQQKHPLVVAMQQQVCHSMMQGGHGVPLHCAAGPDSGSLLPAAPAAAHCLPPHSHTS